MVEQHRFAVKVIHLSRAWRSELDRRFADKGLSQARWLVLLHLGHYGDEPPTQRELANSVGIESPTLARTLDALEQAGFVVRQPCQNDRRVNKVLLTDQARQVVGELEDAASRLRSEIFSGISMEEVDHCQRLLEKMLHNISRVSS